MNESVGSVTVDLLITHNISLLPFSVCVPPKLSDSGVRQEEDAGRAGGDLGAAEGATDQLLRLAGLVPIDFPHQVPGADVLCVGCG